MKKLGEEVAYLKGLAEGLDIDDKTKEGKMIGKIVDVLDSFAGIVQDLEYSVEDLEDQVEDAIKFLKENEVATIRFYQGQPFQVEAPNFAELEVTETEPGIKGDTASNVTKAATVETGAVVQVPLFINEGDKIKIDTRTGEYLSRV